MKIMDAHRATATAIVLFTIFCGVITQAQDNQGLLGPEKEAQARQISSIAADTVKSAGCLNPACRPNHVRRVKVDGDGEDAHGDFFVAACRCSGEVSHRIVVAMSYGPLCASTSKCVHEEGVTYEIRLVTQTHAGKWTQGFLVEASPGIHEGVEGYWWYRVADSGDEARLGLFGHGLSDYGVTKGYMNAEPIPGITGGIRLLRRYYLDADGGAHDVLFEERWRLHDEQRELTAKGLLLAVSRIDKPLTVFASRSTSAPKRVVPSGYVRLLQKLTDADTNWWQITYRGKRSWVPESALFGFADEDEIDGNADFTDPAGDAEHLSRWAGFSGRPLCWDRHGDPHAFESQVKISPDRTFAISDQTPIYGTPFAGKVALISANGCRETWSIDDVESYHVDDSEMRNFRLILNRNGKKEAAHFERRGHTMRRVRL